MNLQPSTSEIPNTPSPNSSQPFPLMSDPSAPDLSIVPGVAVNIIPTSTRQLPPRYSSASSSLDPAENPDFENSPASPHSSPTSSNHTPRSPTSSLPSPEYRSRSISPQYGETYSSSSSSSRKKRRRSWDRRARRRRSKVVEGDDSIMELTPAQKYTYSSRPRSGFQNGIIICRMGRKNISSGSEESSEPAAIKIDTSKSENQKALPPEVADDTDSDEDCVLLGVQPVVKKPPLAVVTISSDDEEDQSKIKEEQETLSDETTTESISSAESSDENTDSSNSSVDDRTEPSTD